MAGVFVVMGYSEVAGVAMVPSETRARGGAATALGSRDFMQRTPRKMCGMTLAIAVFGMCFGSAGAQNRSTWRRWKDRNAALSQHGVSVSGWVQLDGSSVASGGQPNADGFVGQYLMDVAARVDTEKLLHWPGGTLNMEGQTHGGSNILDRQFPAIQDPDNMDAPPGTWLAQLSYQQNLLRGKLRAQAGLMYVDSRFLTVPYGGNFVSLSFSSDGSISTFVLPTYPKGAWGGDLTVTLRKGLSFAGGIYDNHSTELSYDPGGSLLVTEEAWSGRRRGLPYKVQVGAWRDTGKFRRFQGGTVHHASGLYVVASDKLWQPEGDGRRGVGMFFQYGSAPASVAKLHHHVGAGVVWDGAWKARPKDEMGLAFSDGLLTKQSVFAHGFENEVEVYYQFALWHGLTVQPDVEIWQHPGGGGTPNTVLGLVRAMYTF